MIKYHTDLIQGSDDWLEARRGILTASEMKLIITPGTNKPASNDKERAHMYELAAQRISGYVEPHYIGEDMLRGMSDEIEARILYEKNFLPVTDMGFITNDKWGFAIGYSPDGLVCDNGAIECKSRRQRFQIETIANDKVPDEYIVQLQTGLLVSERDFIDFVSYSGGLPLYVKRVYPDLIVQKAIIDAATVFHDKMSVLLDKYKSASTGMIMTERKLINEGEIQL